MNVGKLFKSCRKVLYIFHRFQLLTETTGASLGRGTPTHLHKEHSGNAGKGTLPPSGG